MQNFLVAIIVILIVLCFQTAQPHFPKRYSTQGMLRAGKAKGSTPANPAWFLTSCIFVLMAASTLANVVIQAATHGLSPNALWWAILVIIVLVQLLCAALCMVRALHVWAWDAQHIEWRGVLRETKIPWADAATFGKTWDGNFRIAPFNGRGIKWSRISTQMPEAVSAAVMFARPDLADAPAAPLE